MENDYKDIILILEAAGGAYQYSVLDAVKANDLAKVNKLLDNEFVKENALYDAAMNTDEKTSLMWASEKGYTEIASALITAGADVNKVSSSLRGKSSLIFAAIGGHTEIVKLLLAANVIVQQQDYDKKTALDYATENSHAEIIALLTDISVDADKLILAVKANDLAEVRALITAGVNLDTLGKDGTALMIATDRDYRNIMTALINAGANLDIQDDRGNTALMKAASYTSIELATLQLLITSGADLNIQDNDGGRTALFMTHDIEKVRALINAGANLNIKGYVNGRDATVLMGAIFSSSPEKAKLLIASGADLEIKNDIGETALHYAASKDISILRALIDAGAKLDIQDNYGYTALMSSVNHPDNAKLLIDRGAKLDIQDNSGDTALMDASHSQRITQNRAKTQKHLIDAGANLNIQDNNGYTALAFSLVWISENYTLSLQAALNLIEASPTADNNIYSSFSGQTVLIYASRHGYKEIVYALISKNANLDIKSSDNKTALDYAIENGHIEIKNALIAAGAKDSPISIITAAKTGDIAKINQLIAQDFEIDYRDDKGITALMHAAQNRHEAVVNALINAGADINARIPSSQETPLMFASIGADVNIVRILLDLGADINAKSKSSTTSLMMAATTDNGYEATKFLIDRGADIHVKQAQGANALMLMSANNAGDIKSARYLIDAGIDIEAQDQSTYTALIHAANGGSHEILNLLIEKNANVDARTRYGYNALYYAYSKYVGANTEENEREKFKKCFDILSETNMNLDLQYINENDSTLLIIVAAYGSEHDFGCVKKLLASGADKAIVNKNGKTAADVAFNDTIKNYIINFVYTP